MSHDELRDAIPALALDALPRDERILVETHASTCAGCSFELREYREVAALLAYLSPVVAPPRRLRRRIVEGLAEAVPRSPVVTPLRPVPQPAVTAAFPVGRRRAMGRLSRQRLAALGAAALLVLGGAGVTLLRGTSGEERLRAEQRGRVTAITRGPHTVVPMHGTASAPEAGGEILVASNGQAAVLMRGLPSPGLNTYALWLIVEGGAHPLGDFRPDASGAAAVAPSRTIGHDPRIAVTLEGRSGNRLPEGPTILKS
jgi:hypothetical protein